MDSETVKLDSKSITNSPPKGIATYLRVSTKKQEKNTSMETQLNCIEAYINQQKWSNSPVFKYSDIASASKPLKSTSKNTTELDGNVLTRTGIIALLHDAYLKKFDTLIIYSHDRLTRNVQESLLLRYTLEKLKIKIIYCRPGEQISSEDQTINDFFENLMSNIAALESDVIASRVKPNNQYNIDHNIWAGGPSPYGYKLIPLPSNRKKSIVEVSPYEARIVKRIFELYNLGYAPKYIAIKIQEEYPFNKDRLWSINTIKDILNNPTYTGNLVWNKRGGHRNPVRHNSDDFIRSKIIKDNIVISNDSWNKAQEIRKLKKKNHKFLSTDFLLKDFIVCKTCGQNLIAKNYGNGKRYYFCSNYCDSTNKRPKRHISIRSLALDDIVIKNLEEQISAVFNSDSIFDKFYDRYVKKVYEIIDTNTKNSNHVKETLAYNTDLLDDCEKEILRFKNDVVIDLNDKDNEIKNSLFLESLCELKTYLQINIKSITDNIEFLEKNNTITVPTKEDLSNIIKNMGTPLQVALNSPDTKDKYRSLRLLFHNIIYKIIVSNDRSIEIIFK